MTHLQNIDLIKVNTFLIKKMELHKACSPWPGHLLKRDIVIYSEEKFQFSVIFITYAKVRRLLDRDLLSKVHTFLVLLFT